MVGTGLWSIVSGSGGSVAAPTNPTSAFTGVNGSTYTLRWTITNGTCTSTSDVNISFPLLPVQPLAFTASKTPVCQGEIGVVYTVPLDAGVTYNWSYTGGTGATFNGSGNSVTVDYSSSATSGTIEVTATNGCGTSAARTVNVTVNPLPSVNPTATLSTICYGSTSQLDAGITGATSYSWSPADSLAVGDAVIQNPVYTPGGNPTSLTQITTTFTVTVTDSNGCTDSGSVNVTVNRTPETGPQYHVGNEWGK